MLQRFGVVGNPIEHSLSPVIHQCFGKQTNISLGYNKIKADNIKFEQIVVDFFAQGGKGLNITLPFKQRAFALAKQRTQRCNLAGATNTLWIQDQQIHADNTDGIGLIRDLEHYIFLPGKRVLIIGTGGAARGIIHPLLENGLSKLVVVNRTAAKADEFRQIFPQVQCIGIDELNEPFDLVINATSASLVGDFITLPQVCLSQKPFCYDLSYKQHVDTAFVHYAKEQRCDAIDGLGMLVEQAAEAFFIWHEVMPQTQEVLKYLRNVG
ncbi:MAG: shikimate dehydrogenase [Legionella sp.]|uniref:shikimate dehydrogenase n=1 Tax=Legionella sp. TaxID=459 RepID=UPI0039E50065